MDRLAVGECDLEREVFDGHALRAAADEVHLDAAGLGVEGGAMGESLQVEGAAERAIDAGQEVEVEGPRDAEGIVVSRLEDVEGLDEIGPEEERVVRSEDGAD